MVRMRLSAPSGASWLNGDSDANDAGEAAVWFSEAGNASGVTLPTPNGLAEDNAGGIYVINAGVASRPVDRQPQGPARLSGRGRCAAD